MSSIVDQVTHNPVQIFEADQAVLRQELQGAETRELKLFLRAFQDWKWEEEVAEERKLDLMLRLSCVLPETAVTDAFEILDEVGKRLMKMEVRPPKGEEVLKMTQENSKFKCAMDKKMFAGQGYKDLSNDQILLLNIRDFFNNRMEDPENLLLGYYLEQIEDIASRIDGMDLADMILSGTGGSWDRVIDAYERKGAQSIVKEKLMQAFPWNGSPQSFRRSYRYLPDEMQKNLASKHLMLIFLNFAMSERKEDREFIFAKIQSWGLDTRQIFRSRHKGHMTYLEKYLLMLGYREPVKELQKMSGLEKVHVSKTDSLYRKYDPEKAEKILQQKRKKVIDYISEHRNDPDLWKNEKLIKYVQSFMKRAFLDTVFLFRDAWERSRKTEGKSGDDGKKMEEFLDDQSLKKPFSYYYRYGSFLEQGFFIKNT